MKYRVTHLTRYESQEKVSIGMNQVYLTPRSTPWQQCEYSRVMTSPVSQLSDRRIDYYGNQVNYFSFERGYHKLEIRASSRVQVLPRTLMPPEQSPLWNKVVQSLHEQVKQQFAELEFALPSPLVTESIKSVAEYAKASFPADRPILLCLQNLLERFGKDFEFDNSATTVNTPIAHVMHTKRGVCQDFAHVLLAMLRSLGLPSRYVSGYLRTYPAEGQPRLRGADASHAWVSVYCGPLGWVDIDPTNHCFVKDEHITVAWGRD